MSAVLIQRYLALVCVFGLIFGVNRSGIAQDCDPVFLDHLFDADPDQGSTFGSCIAISGDMALIGVMSDVVEGVNTGSVHVFRFDGEHWNFEYRIVPSDGIQSGSFGVWFSMDGDSLLIGATGDDDLGERSGSVYAYRYVDGQWTFLQKLMASDGQANDGFGTVDLDGDSAVVGAVGRVGSNTTGSAYIFEFDGVAWSEVQIISASDAEAGDHFGFSPKLDGNRLVVGAAFQEYFFEVKGGAVYIFDRVGGHWTESAKLEPESQELGYAFGFELGLLNDMVMVGDYESVAEGRMGEVVVFELVNENWIKTDLLYPKSTKDVSGFGGEIEVSGDVLLVDAPFSNDRAGLVFIYRLVDGIWIESGILESPDASPDQIFGVRMGIDGQRVIASSPDADHSTGTAYFFDLGCSLCLADLNGDSVLSFEDLLAFLMAFGGLDPVADFTEDGYFDFFDISAFLSAFSAGCP